MSIREDQEPTPAHVAEMANETARLDRLALIGVFGSETARAALIRARDGQIQRVAVGDIVAGKTVSAIDQDRVILTRGSQSSTLELPNS